LGDLAGAAGVKVVGLLAVLIHLFPLDHGKAVE